MSANPKALAIATSPFDDREADIVIRSSDQVEFYVHKIILSVASPVFRDMFALAQPSRSSTGKEEPVEVQESSIVLDMLLRLCYPVAAPSIGLNDIVAVLESARKYQMDGVKGRMKEILLLPNSWQEQPLQVYALACGCGFSDVAMTAARCLLRRELFNEVYTKDLRQITGGAYHRLLEYRRDCSRAATAVASAQSHQEWMGEINPTALEKCPHGAVVSTTTVLRPVIENLPHLCDKCSKSVPISLFQFAKLLEDEVEKAVSQVVLKVED
ncbi:hypothetical protein A0H81_13587 [Grifola frondosa]|uniref:BTB domain-containing protein n=1 Tax=Grifola frondosa TaxID=5627 RepID=A0A1C7LR28_GRIFR|nr:hypothetical protein A0H81_13587 [Grifola frondosa]